MTTTPNPADEKVPGLQVLDEMVLRSALHKIHNNIQCPQWALNIIRDIPDDVWTGKTEMSVAVAADFADNPRDKTTLQAPADSKEELRQALRVLSAEVRRLKALSAAKSAPQEAQVAVGIPAAQWREKGEPDPHNDRYKCERAELCMGQLSDDELANAVFLYGDAKLTMEQMLKGEPAAHVYLTAAKDRIRWLSRKVIELQALAATPSREVAAVERVKELEAMLNYVVNEVLPTMRSYAEGDQWETVEFINAAIEKITGAKP